MATLTTPINGAPPAPQRELHAGIYFLVLAFFAVYYAFPVAWVPGLRMLHPGKIVGAGLLLALLLNVSSLSRALVREVIYLLLLLLQFFLASILSTAWKGGAVATTVHFAQVVLVIVAMAVGVTSIGRLRKLLFVQAACAAVIALLSLRGAVGGAARLVGAVQRSNYSNSNDLALALVLTLPFCFYFFFRTPSPFRKLIWAGAMLAMTGTTLLTASRSGFLALSVVAAVSLWEFGVKQRRFYLIFITVVLGVAFFAFAGKKMEERLSGTFNAKENYDSSYGSAQTRKNLLIDSLKITAEHPLFGVGPGNFKNVSGTWQDTHNLYTGLSAEGGLPSLILFLMIYWRAFANLREARRRAPERSELATMASAMQSSLLAFAVAAFFFPDTYEYFVYLMLALPTAALQVAKQAAPVNELDSNDSSRRTYGMAAPSPHSAVSRRLTERQFG